MPRDSNGNYTLPGSVNPVISGTTITSAWANTTLADVAQGLTDSLDRSGRGGMLAPFRLADGSVGLPSLAFSLETSTGLYRAGTNIVGFSVGGVEAFRISNTGAQHAGNLTVGGALSVLGGATLGDAAGDALTINSATANIPNGINFSGGRVGVGVAPTYHLDIRAASSPVLRLASVDGAEIYMQANSNVDVKVGSLTNAPLLFQVSGVERMRIDTSGNVGVGAAPGISGLDVNMTLASQVSARIKNISGSGAASTTFLLDNGAVNAGMFLVGTGNTGAAGASSLNFYTTGSVPIAFSNAGGERMRIGSDGNVGIANAGSAFGPAAQALVIGGNSRSTTRMSVHGGGTSDVSVSFDTYGTTGSAIGVNLSGAVNPYGSTQGTMYIGMNQAYPIILLTNSIERLRVTATGQLYGTALHNNASGAAGSTNQYIASGTYTPTGTALNNISAITPDAAQWLRVGNVVTVSGSLSVTTSAGGGAITRFSLTLPLASGLTATAQCNGAGVTASGEGVQMSCDVATDVATGYFGSTAANTKTITYTYTYLMQ